VFYNNRREAGIFFYDPLALLLAILGTKTIIFPPRSPFDPIPTRARLQDPKFDPPVWSAAEFLSSQFSLSLN